MKNACEAFAFLYHFYAEIVKFGLILTHLKLFWGKTGGSEENNLGGKFLPCPCSTATVCQRVKEGYKQCSL